MEGCGEDALILAMCDNSIKLRFPPSLSLPRPHLAKAPSLITCCFASCEGSKPFAGGAGQLLDGAIHRICGLTGMTNPSLVSLLGTTPATSPRSSWTCWHLGTLGCCSSAWSEASEGEGNSHLVSSPPGRAASLLEQQWQRAGSCWLPWAPQVC